MKHENEIHFFHDFEPPTTTFQARNSRWRPTPAARKAMATWQAVLEQYKPAEPLKGPVRLVIEFYFTGKHEVRGNHDATMYRTSKPDLDNLLKGMLDICTKLAYWQDDAQIVSIHAEKCTSGLPGVYFRAKAISAEVDCEDE